MPSRSWTKCAKSARNPPPRNPARFMRVLIDCNIIVSAAISGGVCLRVIAEARDNHTILVSEEILDEYRRVTVKRSSETHQPKNALRFASARFAATGFPASTISPKTSRILAFAISAKALSGQRVKRIFSSGRRASSWERGLSREMCAFSYPATALRTV